MPSFSKKKAKEKGKGKGKTKGNAKTQKASGGSSERRGWSASSSSHWPTYSYSSSYLYRPSYFSKGAVGLKNEGNTCYFNAMLQTVFNTEPFVSPLLDSVKKSECWVFAKCTGAFTDMLVSVHSADTSSPLSTKALRRALSARDSMFTDGRQHDSWLALSHLLSQVACEWSAANPSMRCPIGLRFERPFGKVPAEVSHREFAAFNLKVLTERKVLAQPIACFYGVNRDSLQCHDCLQTSTRYSATRSLEVKWDAVGCAVRVICVENGEFKGTRTCKAETGLGEDSTVANLRNVLVGDAIADRYDHQLLFFSLRSVGDSLNAKPVLCDTTSLSDLSSASLLAVRSDERMDGGAYNARLAFSLVIGADGSLLTIDGLRDFALIPSGALLRSGSKSIHAVCAEAIGLDECKIDVQSEDREFDMYVAYGSTVLYDWNKDKVLQSSASLPLVLVLWHRSNARDSAVGRQWKLPCFCPKSTSIAEHSAAAKLSLTDTVAHAISAVMAMFKRQNPAVSFDTQKAIEEWNRQVPIELPVAIGDIGKRTLDQCHGADFCRKAANEVLNKWKLTPLFVSKRFLPRTGLLLLDECILQSERKIECSFPDSRCMNPDCAKRAKSFTRTLEMVLPPPVLAVHLNRDVDGSEQKDNRPVECPLLWEFKGVSYRMVGAAIHGGSTIRFGHYTAKARNMHSGEWFAANDSSITDMAKPAAISHADLVVYVRDEDLEDASEDAEEETDEFVEETKIPRRRY